jgi:hypothetical protein
MNHCLGEADPLEHSFRIAPDTTVTSLGEADDLEEFRNAIPESLTREPAELAVEGDRFRAGQELVEVGILWQEADIDSARDTMARHAEDLGSSCGGGNESQQDLQCGAFSGAVGPE